VRGMSLIPEVYNANSWETSRVPLSINTGGKEAFEAACVLPDRTFCKIFGLPRSVSPGRYPGSKNLDDHSQGPTRQGKADCPSEAFGATRCPRARGVAAGPIATKPALSRARRTRARAASTTLAPEFLPSFQPGAIHPGLVLNPGFRPGRSHDSR
jgi:hypothetical protein